MNDRFKITRKDGRSNAQVLLDYVKDKDAGTVFTYDEIAAELSAKSGRTYTEKDVQQSVQKLYPRLLKEQARALHNVRNVGYRIAPAGFHVALAVDRKSKADRQLLRGVQTLEHVRWEEMTPNQRTAHEGQLMIIGALYQQSRAVEKRVSLIEEAIKKARVPNVTLVEG